MRNKEKEATIKGKQKQARSTYGAYRRVFESEDGQVILQDLMRSCFYMKSTLGQSSEETHYNEGRRSVIISLLRTTKMTPEEVNRIVTGMEQEDKNIYGF
jgi:hypothetical protein